MVLEARGQYLDTEAIADVCRHCPIDQHRIVLARFSMGGYGVYRTHYETPGTYKALVVFCGIPDLAYERVGQGGHPDFLQDEYLAPFKDVPMFVFHGTADRNAPFEKTVQVVEKLRAVGARVAFVVQEGVGHGAPSAEHIAQYHHWKHRTGVQLLPPSTHADQLFPGCRQQRGILARRFGRSVRVGDTVCHGRRRGCVVVDIFSAVHWGDREKLSVSCVAACTRG
jgi:fermentation-respiration switch protein FrsA (DUF1100 family)